MNNTKEQDSLLMPTKEQMVDSSGRPMTQSLFLELQYSPSAIYTLKDEDYEYNGKVLPSLKRLYLEEEDPTEYYVATKYLLGVRHWLRICDNKAFKPYIDEWRFELELKLRAKGVKGLIASAQKGSQTSLKWLTDRGWSDRPAGRPSKEEMEREKKIMSSITSEYEDDFKRLRMVN